MEPIGHYDPAHLAERVERRAYIVGGWAGAMDPEGITRESNDGSSRSEANTAEPHRTFGGPDGVGHDDFEDAGNRHERWPRRRGWALHSCISISKIEAHACKIAKRVFLGRRARLPGAISCAHPEQRGRSPRRECVDRGPATRRAGRRARRAPVRSKPRWSCADRRDRAPARARRKARASRSRLGRCGRRIRSTARGGGADHRTAGRR